MTMGSRGEHEGALRDGVDVAGEFEVRQIVEEVGIKNAQTPQIFNVLAGKMQILHIADQLLDAAHDGIAAPEGIGAVEGVEDNRAVLLLILEVALHHCQLVQVGEKGQVLSVHEFSFCAAAPHSALSAACRGAGPEKMVESPEKRDYILLLMIPHLVRLCNEFSGGRACPATPDDAVHTAGAVTGSRMTTCRTGRQYEDECGISLLLRELTCYNKKQIEKTLRPGCPGPKAPGQNRQG